MTIHFLTPDPVPLMIAISAAAEVCTITRFSAGYALLFSCSRYAEIVATGFPAEILHSLLISFLHKSTPALIQNA